jgi:hypothetical protein
MTKRDKKIAEMLEAATTPEQAWDVIDRYMLSPGAPPYQRSEMRRAFMMGVGWAIASIASEASKITRGEGAAFVIWLAGEMKRFGANLKDNLTDKG